MNLSFGDPKHQQIAVSIRHFLRHVTGQSCGVDTFSCFSLLRAPVTFIVRQRLRVDPGRWVNVFHLSMVEGVGVTRDSACRLPGPGSRRRVYFVPAARMLPVRYVTRSLICMVVHEHVPNYRKLYRICHYRVALM